MRSLESKKLTEEERKGIEDTTDKLSVMNWMKNPITRLFFQYVRHEEEVCDITVHKALETGDLEEAARYNAGMTQLKRVLDMPNEMVDEAEEEVKDEGE